LSQALSRGLKVNTDTCVTQITEQANGCKISLTASGRSCELSFDAVIVAVEGNRAETLVPNIGVEDAHFLNSVTYNSALYLHLLVEGSFGVGQWFLSGERFGWLSAVKLASVNLADKVLGTHAILTISPEILDELGLDIAPQRLLDHARQEVEQLVPELTKRLRHWFAQPIVRKTPLFFPGYGHAVHAFRQRQRVSRSRILFCGDYLCQPLLGGAAYSGHEAADLLLQRLDPQVETQVP